MTLREKVPRRHLPVTAHFLALCHQILLASLPVGPQLLVIRHAVVDAGHLAIGHAGLTFGTLRLYLMTFDAGLAFDALRLRLMTLHAGLTFDALRLRLMALHAGLPLDTLRTGLLALGALHALRAFRAFRPRLIALWTLERSELLLARRTLRTLLAALLRTLDTLIATVPLSGLLLTVLVLATSMRPRIRRGCDR